MIDDAGIPLTLVTGADIHIVSDLVVRLRSGRSLSLADSRYVLLELPHHLAPARLEACFFTCASAGYVPVLTHPERLLWIDSHYDAIKRLAVAGTWMQVTAASLMGTFGRRARYWAERMLDDGIVHILATDAHDIIKRPPALYEGRRRAEAIVGPNEALNLVETRPRGILENAAPNTLPSPGSGACSDVDSEGALPGSANDAEAHLRHGSRHLDGSMQNFFSGSGAG